MSRWEFAQYQEGDLVCWRNFDSDISTGIVFDYYTSNVYEKASYDIYMHDGRIVNLESRGLFSIEGYENLMKSD